MTISINKPLTVRFLCHTIVFLSFIGNLEASTNTFAFNTGTGVLNVDYAGYLSKHDVVYNTPNTNPICGLTVGNGRVGAIVWNTNGLMMQLSGVDTSPQTQYGAGLVNFYTKPGMDTGYTNYQQRLSLGSGLLTTTYDANRTVTIMGSPNSEVFGIHVVDSRTGVSSATVDLKLWDVSGEPAPWNTVATYANATGAGLSRGPDPNHFGYTLAASVDGATFTSSLVNSLTVRLSITSSSNYTIWIACASRLNAPSYDSVTQAKTLLSSVKSAGYAATLASNTNFWSNFWGKSFVQYSDAALTNYGYNADYLENIYYLSTYMIASGGYGNYPFHFINGVYRATQDSTKWSNAYWFWNQRCIYNSFLASGHGDMLDVLNNLYFRNYSTLKAYTSNRFGIDGIMVPETMVWNGGPALSSFTSNILSTASEVAVNMDLRYKYTRNTAYLTNVAYPYLREVAKFYSSQLAVNPTNGQYYEPFSNAHETYWGVTNAITDLASVRSVFPMAIEASTLLNTDATLRAQWQNILTNLVPYPTDGTNYLPCYPFPVPSHNGENVACETIWPYSTTGIGATDYPTALNTWNVRPFPYNNIWANDAIQAARLGLGDAAYAGMKTMLSQYQSYPNGMTANNNGVFEYLGLHLTAMNESLLQSYNDKIRVFPALPNNSAFINKFTLLAKDGFLVSSERENNEIKYVGIKSLYGQTAVVENPWGTQPWQVRRASDNAILVTSASNEVSFGTVSNTVYIVERTAKPLSNYTYEQLAGTANQTPKFLGGTLCSLGNFPPGYLPPPTGLAATTISTNQISLSWTASAGATSYNIKRASVNGGFYTNIVTGITTTNYSDTGLASGTTCYYVISAVNTNGESANSVQVIGRPTGTLINRATGGTATASAQNPPGQTAAQAFDGSTGTKWFNANGGSTGWLQYNFGAGVTWAVTRYDLSSANDVPTRDPRDWQFQGSPDGTNWTTLDTQAMQIFPSRNQTKQYTINNTTVYQYYRLNILGNNGDVGLQFSEMALYDGGISTSASWSQGQPVTADSSQTGSGNYATNGNDGSLSTRWAANDNLYPHWWRVDLGTNCNLSSVTIYWYGTGGRSYQYKIEVSTNDIDYVMAVDKTGNTSTANTTDPFTAMARYVRITVTGVVPTGGNASFYECLVYGSVVPSVSLVPTNMTMAGTGNTLALSWPADHLGWHLQVQTNASGAGLGTNWVTLSGSDLITGTNVMINPANSVVFYRLVYP
jgi:hypothetical protein